MNQVNPLDRRPIAARDLRASQKIAQSLARMGLSPNAISLLGMGFGVCAGVSLWLTSTTFMDSRFWLAISAQLILLRLLANMFDGMVAVETGKSSRLGEIYNEVPDRVSDSVILIGAGYAIGGWPEMGYIAALFAMGTAYVRVLGKTVAESAYDFCGPLAKQQRMFLVILVCLIALVLPDLPRSVQGWGLPADASWMALVLVIIAVGSFATCLRRLFRIVRTLRSAA